MEISGITIAAGDLVIADDDGVVIWPAGRIDELMAKAQARRRSDQETAARLAAGGDLG